MAQKPYCLFEVIRNQAFGNKFFKWCMYADTWKSEEILVLHNNFKHTSLTSQIKDISFMQDLTSNQFNPCLFWCFIFKVFLTTFKKDSHTTFWPLLLSPEKSNFSALLITGNKQLFVIYNRNNTTKKGLIHL